MPKGLTLPELQASLATLRAMAAEVAASAQLLQQFPGSTLERSCFCARIANLCSEHVHYTDLRIAGQSCPLLLHVMQYAPAVQQLQRSFLAARVLNHKGKPVAACMQLPRVLLPILQQANLGMWDHVFCQSSLGCIAGAAAAQALPLPASQLTEPVQAPAAPPVHSPTLSHPQQGARQPMPQMQSRHMQHGLRSIYIFRPTLDTPWRSHSFIRPTHRCSW